MSWYPVEIPKVADHRGQLILHLSLGENPNQSLISKLREFKNKTLLAKKELKNLLSLPSNASNHYLYGSRKLDDCCGFPSAAADSDFYLIDSAFKLLTSKDKEVALQALGQLNRTVKYRIERDPTDGDLGSYMSGSMEGSFADSTNQLSNTWTLARNASRRQMVTWSFKEGSPSITFGDECLTATKRRKVMKAFHENLQISETSMLIGAPPQGKAMDCVIMSPTSSHFLTDGMYTRFADWRFIHKARLSLVPLNGYKKWNDNIQTMCRNVANVKKLCHMLSTTASPIWRRSKNAIMPFLRRLLPSRAQCSLRTTWLVRMGCALIWWLSSIIPSTSSMLLFPLKTGALLSNRRSKGRLKNIHH
ncbi:reverse transcriptase domain-containing protein [Trichonephila clavipes]|nr:reverse transcriptase domain-containing protein [Trichonephila clavipes]